MTGLSSGTGLSNSTGLSSTIGLWSGNVGLSGFSPLTLFAAGEQGAWYDPSDLTTMYQDSAGTTAAVVGSPVGLMLDKRLGLVRGPELVTNGDFATGDFTGFSSSTDWVISGGGAAINSGAGTSVLTPDITAAGTFLLTFDVTSWTSGRLSVRGNAGAYPILLGEINAVGSYSVFIPAGTIPSFIRQVEIANMTIDNISVKEIPGNHATQSTTASKPILARNPVGGRRNLFTYTEQFDNAAWTKINLSTTANATTAPDGTITADKIIEDTTTTRRRLSLSMSVTSGLSYTQTVYAKQGERPSLYLLFASTQFSSNRGAEFNLSTGTVAALDGSAVATIEDVGDGWYRCSLTVPCTSTGSALIETLMGPTGLAVTNPSYTGDGTSGIFVWGAQFEQSATATAYQRVVSQYDVTETGKADCYYLAFDGVDDGMATAAIDFSASDEMSVFAGVRKLSDGAIGMIAETSVDAAAGNNGAFYALGSVPGGAPNYSFQSRGTANATVTSPPTFAAPITNIFSGLANIGGASNVLRINGAQVVASAASQGTGNFGNYPLYIGRRAGTSLPFNGRIYSLVIRGALTADANLTSAEAYVAGKTGITI